MEPRSTRCTSWRARPPSQVRAPPAVHARPQPSTINPPVQSTRLCNPSHTRAAPRTVIHSCSHVHRRVRMRLHTHIHPPACAASDPIRAMHSFRDNKTSLLLCTPQASRGGRPVFFGGAGRCEKGGREGTRKTWQQFCSTPPVLAC